MAVRVWLTIALLSICVLAHAQSPQPFARVTSAGQVTNILLWDGSSVYNAAPDTLVATSGNVNAQVGGTYLAGVFSPAGAMTPSYLSVIGQPTSRTLVMGTAYQALQPAKGAHLTINFSSQATLSLAVGVTNSAQVVIGPTSSVATTKDYTVGAYTNTLAGSLVVGLNIQQSIANTCSFVLPAGWWFAVLPTQGAVTITAAYEQPVG